MKTEYDVIIAGAGIIGLAAGLKILELKPGTRLLVLEKENGIAKHQTGHNSGVIHSGIYYKPGSFKAKNCIEGYNKLIDFCNRENVPYEICGKVIVAVNDAETRGLDKIYERGIANGLSNIRKIDKNELKELEPYANGVKAIHVPYTGIIDFKVVARKFADILSEKGGEIKLNSRVSSVKKADQKILEVILKDRSFTSKIFINCCGLNSDDVARRAGDSLNTRIIPFRGEYYKLKPEKKYLVKNLIYPVPDPDFPFLGVHFTRMLNGEIEAGPHAVLSFKKEGYSRTSFNFKDTAKTFSFGGFHKIALKHFKTGMGEFYRSFNKKAFVAALQKLLPGLNEEDLVKGGAGVRAQAVGKGGSLLDDFLITGNDRIINVLNAPAPAATSSLSIGETIACKIINKL